ncbi:helicase IV [Kineobactrum sediminis]|uniref:DNA 3'-5' helicase n=1 Tax=Kineobactrum sediminis TaxID=1905677 RepID=A0A2N5Y4J2_9GAMM|nr:UvrD-helicase domain-containing protein [Kineobactrum sediminis]PLW83298.1 helicase IV [Kineobactrum sediminis]
MKAAHSESKAAKSDQMIVPERLHFSAGFWFALLGRPVGVTLDEDRIQITARSGVSAFKLVQLSATPEHESGLLWDTLVFQVGDQTLRVRGLRQGCDAATIQRFRERCSAWVGEQASSFKAEISSILMGAYLRDSHIEHLDAQINVMVSRSRRFYGGLSRDSRKAHEWLEDVYPLSAHKSRLREAFVKRKTQEHAAFFRSAESNPLTEEQTRAVILDDDRNLVLAAAGTGKTSVIVAKTLYMILEGMARPEEILVLAYSRKAREELQERLNHRLQVMQEVMPGRFPNDSRPQVSTFHSIGLKIMAQSGYIAKVSQFAEYPSSRKRWLTKQLDEYLHGGAEPITQFIGAIHPVCDPFEFESQREYERFHRDNVYETLNGDKVRSYQELLIGNWFYIQGIEHTYEPNYDRTAFSSLGYLYRPDFHINGTLIYLEHFGIDRKDNTRRDIDAVAYNDGIRKKREIHRANGTTLLETYHYEWCEGMLYASLEARLQEVGVVSDPRSWSEIHHRLNELNRVSQYAEVFDHAISAVRLERLSHDGIMNRFKQAKYANAEYFYPILIHLLDAYIKALKDTGEIDFEDMIIHAIDAVEEVRFEPTWKYILVDEFQDISQLRMDLLNTIMGKVSLPSLYCVGDDWQSIYRFSGGKLELTTRFEQLIGTASKATIQKTFRYNNSIAKVAGDFVMKNPEQYKKLITTADMADSPQVYVVDTRLSEVAHETDEGAKIRAIVETIRRNDPDGSIAVLGRYNFVLDNIRAALACSPELGRELIYWTFHGSKGLEADYCILAGFRQGRFGFPSENRTEEPVEALLPSLDGFSYSEERRLMYVALTRARKKSYIVTDPLAPSVFVEELMVGGDVDIRSPRFHEAYRASYKCPDCIDGYLVKRYKYGKTYYTCNGYPGCRTKAKACGECDGVMAEANLQRQCRSKDCTHIEYLCPQCARPLRLQRGSFGEFWGCSGFGARGNERCTYKTKKPAGSSAQVFQGLD